LVVTSANAVPALAALDKALPVFAVGGHTAASVRDAGFADVRSAEGDAKSLAALAANAFRPGTRFIHVAGRDRKREPEVSLMQAGFAVETFVAYEAVAATTLPESLARALREGSLDAALHYSHRTVETALALARAAGMAESFLSLRHLCLSADIAAPLREQGAARLIVAGEPDEASLFAALALCD
jgi:uroporphyrinogen-III synthase